MSTEPDTAVPRGAWAATLLCLAVNLAVFAGVALQRPEYLRDARLCSNPDAWHYVLLGRNMLLTGHYSRCEGPPYVPDMLRPPVYPLFAGALDLLGGPAATYLAQALLQAGSCLLLYRLVRRAFGGRAALWASLFLATDLMLAVYNFESMSEPLFVFLVLASSACVLPVLLSAGARVPQCGPLAERVDHTTARLLGGGLFLGLAILTRPVGLYLPLVFATVVLALNLWRGQTAAGLVGAGILLLPVLLLVGAWVARNDAVFGLPRVSTVEPVVQDYFLGAGAYELHDQVSLEEAQAAISREFHLPPSVVVQNPWTGDRPVAEMDAALRGARPAILAKYPRELVLASVLGVGKATFSHNVEDLAQLLGTPWIAPGTDALLHGQPEAFARLEQDGPVLGGAFVWQLLHVLLALGFGCLGVATAVYCRATRPAALVLLAVLAYLYLTVALFGLEAFYRCRIPALPFLYAFAGYGWAWLVRRRTGGAQPGCAPI
jgi:4-amino-4-deoxy-L-arabinose transferase-like glycosyltransferase